MATLLVFYFLYAVFGIVLGLMLYKFFDWFLDFIKYVIDRG